MMEPILFVYRSNGNHHFRLKTYDKKLYRMYFKNMKFQYALRKSKEEEDEKHFDHNERLLDEFNYERYFTVRKNKHSCRI